MYEMTGVLSGVATAIRGLEGHDLCYLYYFSCMCREFNMLGSGLPHRQNPPSVLRGLGGIRDQIFMFVRLLETGCHGSPG